MSKGGKSIVSSDFDQYRTNAFHWIFLDKPNARRLASRFITKGYWFIHRADTDNILIICSSAVSVEHDINRYLPGLVYEVE